MPDGSTRPRGATHLAISSGILFGGALFLARIEEEQSNRPVRSLRVEQRGHSPGKAKVRPGCECALYWFYRDRSFGLERERERRGAGGREPRWIVDFGKREREGEIGKRRDFGLRQD